MSNSWKKIKYSSTFRRKVSRRFSRITQIVPASSIKLKSTTVVNRQVSVRSTENNENDNNDNHDDYKMKWLTEFEDPEQECILDSEHVELEEENEIFINDLRKWAINYNIPQRSLKELLKIFNKYVPNNNLPIDPRTLLGTPTEITLQQMGEGQYWHQGLEVSIRQCYESIKHLTNISININIDGLPIYKSSNDEFWPILFNIFEIPTLHPMVIGIYNGKTKPPSPSEFLTPFVEEAKPILENGIMFENGHNISVKIRCFISDSPARAFIKGIVNFNGQHGCTKCTTVGEYSYITNCNIFPNTQCPRRTDAGFRSREYGSHHKCYSPLEELQVNMINDFPVADSLHLLDLGIMKRCLMGWKDGSFRNFRMKWSASDVKNISEFLLSCKLPLEIHRAVKGLDCLSFWKGLEYRTFFYYISIVILKDYLAYDVYEHFLLLFCGITICSSTFYSKLIDLADEILQYYIEQYKEIYGEQYITSNVHNLSHLIEDVRKFGILSTFNAYPFENKLYHIKNILRNARFPLVQAAKRICEYQSIGNKNISTNFNCPILKKPNDGEEVNITTNRTAKFYYQIQFADGLTLNTDNKNKWILTRNNEIVGIKNVIVEDNNTWIYRTSLKDICEFFETPIKSSYLDIYASNCKENVAKRYSLVL